MVLDLVHNISRERLVANLSFDLVYHLSNLHHRLNVTVEDVADGVPAGLHLELEIYHCVGSVLKNRQ